MSKPPTLREIIDLHLASMPWWCPYCGAGEWPAGLGMDPPADHVCNMSGAKEFRGIEGLQQGA